MKQDDALGVLILIVMTLLFCFAAVFLGLVFIILVALLFLWAVLTYWLVRLVNDMLTDQLVTESEGLLALVIPAIFWPLLIWVFFPRQWIALIATYSGISALRVWLCLVVGSGLISLGFGFLSLLMLDREDEQSTPKLNEDSMYKLPAGQSDFDFLNGDSQDDWLQKGAFIGEDPEDNQNDWS